MQRQVVCTSCGYRGPARSITGGQVALVVFLGVFFLIPGIAYAIYADYKNKRSCPRCENSTLIPADSPRAIEMTKR